VKHRGSGPGIRTGIRSRNGPQRRHPSPARTVADIVLGPGTEQPPAGWTSMGRARGRSQRPSLRTSDYLRRAPATFPMGSEWWARAVWRLRPARLTLDERRGPRSGSGPRVEHGSFLLYGTLSIRHVQFIIFWSPSATTCNETVTEIVTGHVRAARWSYPVGFQNSATGPDLGFYAARSYSLMRLSGLHGGAHRERSGHPSFRVPTSIRHCRMSRHRAIRMIPPYPRGFAITPRSCDGSSPHPPPPFSTEALLITYAS
jgi:hypothetical protein